MQYPSPGASLRDTSIADHQIDNLTVTVADAETGKFYFNKPHIFIPAVVVVNVQSSTAPHANLYLTEVTNIANWATGSITLFGGTTSADLNGDTFTLIDKDTTSQLFTFNNTDDVVTGGSIGLLTAADEATIITRTKTSINNVSILDITANTITPGSGTTASAANSLSTGTAGGTNGNSDNDEFTINVPVAAGGTGNTVTVRLVANLSSSPGAGQLFVVRATANDTNRTRIKAAFNGTDDAGFDASKIEYGSGVTGGVTGIKGVDASAGSSNSLVSLTAVNSGIAANSIVIANGIGTIYQSIAFTGGGTPQTLEVIQDITGSAGNTAIDMSGVSGGSSTNFVDGDNYGSGSFAASESFTGSLRLRAISLQNQYLM